MNSINILKSILADTYALMLKTHSYHWNVTGSHFFELHTAFEKQYTDLFTAVDRIAERIRALGEYAPGGFKAYMDLTLIEEPKEGLTAEEMLLSLIGDNRKVIARAKEGIVISSQYEDDATSNMLTERIESHEKNVWMMHSFFGDKKAYQNSH